jgi:hypothetical protein
LVSAIYGLGVGVGFIVIPNVLLPLFGFPTTTEVWIRVVGLLALCLSVYEFLGVRNNDLSLFRSSVVVRVIFCIGMVAFALLGFGSFMLAGFGLVDLIFALWTWWALRAQGEWKL